MRRSHHGADDGLRAHFFDPNRKGHVPKLPNCGCGAGVATGRWARRHAAPAVVGRFIFFRDLAFFGDSEDSGFAGHDDGRRRRRRRNRAPPLKPPGSSNRKSPNFYRQFFFQKKIWRQNFFGDFNQCENSVLINVVFIMFISNIFSILFSTYHPLYFARLPSGFWWSVVRSLQEKKFG